MQTLGVHCLGGWCDGTEVTLHSALLTWPNMHYRSSGGNSLCILAAAFITCDEGRIQSAHVPSSNVFSTLDYVVSQCLN